MSPTDRQRVVRVPGARRAQLTPVPGTDTEPETAETEETPVAEASGASGPNDERLRRDVPPHY
jgi:hypothetical protein